MKSMFDGMIRKEVIDRVRSLKMDNKRHWGKMEIYQMAKHCIIWDQWVLGKTQHDYKQGFLGMIFGKIALRSQVKDDRPIKKNMPTTPYFIVRDKAGSLDALKDTWITLIPEYENYSNPRFIHDFFGKMTVPEIGVFAYKHADHHLRQFGC
jgi:hypothetical protein